MDDFHLFKDASSLRLTFTALRMVALVTAATLIAATHAHLCDAPTCRIIFFAARFGASLTQSRRCRYC